MCGTSGKIIIHGDNWKFPKGVIEVKQVELKYKDSQSGNEWMWPLKYLHKYECDRDIFSFVYEMKEDVGMSLHEKGRNKKMPTPRHKVTHNPIPTSLCFFQDHNITYFAGNWMSRCCAVCFA